MTVPIGSHGNLFNPGTPSFSSANTASMAPAAAQTPGVGFSGFSGFGNAHPATPNMNAFANLAAQLQSLVGRGANTFQSNYGSAGAAAPGAASVTASVPQTAIPGLGMAAASAAQPTAASGPAVPPQLAAMYSALASSPAQQSQLLNYYNGLAQPAQQNFLGQSSPNQLHQAFGPSPTVTGQGGLAGAANG